MSVVQTSQSVVLSYAALENEHRHPPGPQEKTDMQTEKLYG